MFELIEPLLWMAACWACGILTGLGLGTAITLQRLARSKANEASI